MDVFVEQLVKRKMTGIDIVKLVLCIAAVSIVVPFMLMFAATAFGTIFLLIGAGLLYFIWTFSHTVSVEYEYCFTNGALDVDRVFAARRRKPLVSLNAREIEYMAPISDRAYRNYAENTSIKKMYACSSLKDEGVYFVVFDNKGSKTMLYFNPNDKIKDGFRRLNPQKVVL